MGQSSFLSPGNQASYLPRLLALMASTRLEFCSRGAGLASTGLEFDLREAMVVMVVVGGAHTFSTHNANFDEYQERRRGGREGGEARQELEPKWAFRHDGLLSANICTTKHIPSY